MGGQKKNMGVSLIRLFLFFSGRLLVTLPYIITYFILFSLGGRSIFLELSKKIALFFWSMIWILSLFYFHQEEKLEPLRNITDDPRIRLLNRLYARKRKELKEREKLKVLLSST